MGDLNGDGKLDLAVANFSADTVSILLNTSDAFPCAGIGFMQPAGSPIGAGNQPASVAIADFNLDGKLDLAVANLSSSDVTILLGNGMGGFSQPADSPVGAGLGPRSVAVADFNLDGKPDLAVANEVAPTGTVTILLGNGMGSFSQPAGSPVGAGSGSGSVAVGDFNLDGKPDLAVGNFGSNDVTILLGNGVGGFSQPAGSPVGAGTNPRSVTVGDFNLDGKPDLAVANINSNDVTILLGDGTGDFAQPAGSPIVVGTFPSSVAANDFNLDGKLDLAVGNFGSNDVTVLLGNGMGSFSQPTGSPVGAGSGPRSVAVADFNLDGKPDLAVANVGGGVTILLGNGMGGLTQPAGSPVGAGTEPNSAAIGDFNRDGKPDLAVANLNSNNVTIQLNTCTANTPPSACLQDEINGNFMFFDTQTGDYLFVVCGQGMQVSGRGTVKTSADGCTVSLTHFGPNQKTVKASINTCNNTGKATLSVVTNNRVTAFSIKDLDTTNNTCACP